MEKKSASDVPHRGLVSGIYEEQWHIKKTSNPTLNWDRVLNTGLQKDDKQVAKKHFFKCSTFLSTRKMQIITTLRFYLTSVRVARNKRKSGKNGPDVVVGKAEHSVPAGRSAN